jgi:hypothetical protein
MAAAANPRTDRQPSLREMIQRHRLARQLPRAPPSEGCHQRAQPNPLRLYRNRRQADPWVSDRRVPRIGVGKQVIPQEDAIPAGRLGLAGKLGHDLDLAKRAEVRNVQGVAHDSPSMYG